jgi:hypothetical protein
MSHNGDGVFSREEEDEEQLMEPDMPPEVEESKLDSDDESKVDMDDESKVEMDDESKFQYDDESKVEMDDESKFEMDEDSKVEMDDESKVDMDDESKFQYDDESKVDMDGESKFHFDDESKVEMDGESKFHMDDESKVDMEDESKVDMDDESKVQMDDESKVHMEDESKVSVDEDDKLVVDEDEKKVPMDDIMSTTQVKPEFQDVVVEEGVKEGAHIEEASAYAPDAASVMAPDGASVKPEPAEQVVQEDDYLDPASIDWSVLTNDEAAKIRKKLDKQERKKRKREEEKEGKRSKKDKKDKKDKEKKEKKHKDKHRDKYSEAGVKTEDVKTEIDEIVEEDDLKPSGAIPSGLDGMQPPRAREMPPAPEVIDPLNSGLSPAENFKRMLSTMKVTKPPPFPVATLEHMAEALVSRMQNAFSEDREDCKRGAPGVKKLRMLEEVKTTVEKAYMQEYLVKKSGGRDFSIMDCFADWLSPVEVAGTRAKQLPNLNIRTTILDLLTKMPLENDLAKVRKRDDLAWDGIARADLEGTKLGQRISWLTRHPNETTENRKKAEKIVERWSRLLFDNTRDYRKLADADLARGRVIDELHQEEWQDPLKNLCAEQIYSQDPEAELEARKERYKRRIRLPQKQLMNFHFRPKSELTPEEMEKREKMETPKERLKNMVKRHAQELKAGNKIGGRSQIMSIEGGLSTLPNGPT